MNFKTGHLLSSDGSGFRVSIVDSFLDGLSENCHVPGIVRKHCKEKRLRQKRAVLMMWSTNSSQGSSSFLSSLLEFESSADPQGMSPPVGLFTRFLKSPLRLPWLHIGQAGPLMMMMMMMARSGVINLTGLISGSASQLS